MRASAAAPPQVATLINSMASHSPSPPSSYRGRLAPSPTGYLHVGHARTFWTAFERVRDAGGVLVMRMEDLDSERSRVEFAEAAIEDLHWLGIRWQEGPDVGGPYAPYAQSGRRAFYLDAWRKLLHGGFLFPCRCSRKDLAAALSAPHEGDSQSPTSAEQEPLDDEPVYPGTCRLLQTIFRGASIPPRARLRSRVISIGASVFPTAKRLSLWMEISVRSALWPA